MGKTYDLAVIGGGFSGLLTALCLQKKGYLTCLVDESFQNEKNTQTAQNDFGLEQRFSLFFDSKAMTKSLNFLENILEEKASCHIQKISPLIFEKGQKLSFKQSSLKKKQILFLVKDLSFYTQDERLILEQPLDLWISKALTLYAGDIFPTRVVDIEKKNQQVVSCLCQDGQQVFAKQFVFCLSLYHLESLLKNHHLIWPHQKSYQVKAWTKICVDFVHASKVTDTLAVHIVLPGQTSKKKQKTTVLGFFQKPGVCQDEISSDMQCSKWMTLITPSTVQDDEKDIEQGFKKIKRCLQRIYPKSLDHTLFERLLVSQEYGHVVSRGKGNPFFKICDNLFAFLLNKNQISTHQGFIEALPQVFEEQIPLKKDLKTGEVNFREVSLAFSQT